MPNIRFTPPPPPPPQNMSSKSVLYFITAFGAAALLLFVLLTISDDASAQQATAATATPTPAAQTPDFPPAPPKRTRPLGNLDSMLSQLASSVQGGYSTAHDAASQAPMHAADSVAVTFYLNGDTAPLLAFLRANGGDPRNIREDYVEAYVPVTLLIEASEQPNVVRVRAIAPRRPARGSVTSQGVAAHAANAWHTAGYTGQNVKVGVIDGGFEGFSALLGSELPANVMARCYTGIGVFTSNLADCETDGTHGTEVSETLLDIAPDVTLYIANPISKDDDRSTVEWLLSQDVDVINFSASWDWDGPGDGTSPNSDSPLRNVDAAVSSGAIWVNSAGNYAKTTWFGAFSNPDFDRWMNFTGEFELNRIDLEVGEKIEVQLRWEGSWAAASRDLDLHLFHESDRSNPLDVLDEEGQLQGVDWQEGKTGDRPFESIIHTATLGGRYYLGVWHAAGNTPSWAQLHVYTDHPSIGRELQFSTNSGSIGNPAESANPGMLAVGASHYWDVNTIAPYSSRGPTPDDRVKPDIVGVACAATSTHGVGFTVTTGQRCWFSGTSQSSPHVAGLAALVKQRFPEYTPAQIANYLKSNAEARGAVPNNDWGYGFAKLPAPTDGETPPEPTPVTPVPTPSGTPVTPVPTPSGTPVGGSGFTQISSGANHACGLRANGSIACWGSNVFGQATPPTTGVFTSISSGDAHTCALRNDGAVVCWGSINNTFTQ